MLSPYQVDTLLFSMSDLNSSWICMQWSFKFKKIWTNIWRRTEKWYRTGHRGRWARRMRSGIDLGKKGSRHPGSVKKHKQGAAGKQRASWSPGHWAGSSKSCRSSSELARELTRALLSSKLSASKTPREVEHVAGEFCQRWAVCGRSGRALIQVQALPVLLLVGFFVCIDETQMGKGSEEARQAEPPPYGPRRGNGRELRLGLGPE